MQLEKQIITKKKPQISIISADSIKSGDTKVEK